MSQDAEFSPMQDLPDGGEAGREEVPVQGDFGVKSLSRSVDEFRFWSALLHVSLLAGIVLPVVGFVVPCLIWQSQREAFPKLDEIAKRSVNLVLWGLIAAGAGLLLTRWYVGYFLVIPAVIAMIAVPVLAGLRAWSGREWHYPLPFEIVTEVPGVNGKDDEDETSQV